jgi:hypothetical protein
MHALKANKSPSQHAALPAETRTAQCSQRGKPCHTVMSALQQETPSTPVDVEPPGSMQRCCMLTGKPHNLAMCAASKPLWPTSSCTWSNKAVPQQRAECANCSTAQPQGPGKTAPCSTSIPPVCPIQTVPFRLADTDKLEQDLYNTNKSTQTAACPANKHAHARPLH